MPMRDQFCNECGLSYGVPRLVAERLLGVEYLHRIENRYEQMRKCYDCTYAEWQEAFTVELKTFGGYGDTTTVTIPIGNSQLGTDIKALHKGAIGVDLPTWFNVQDNKRIMLVAQDPLRNNKRYGECLDAVISSPFGLHDRYHREWKKGGLMMVLLVEKLVNKGYGIYLTDANKFFIYDHKITNKFSKAHIDKYAEIMRQEIEIVKPAAIVCLGRSAERMCKKMGLQDILALPHLSGAARGAMIRRFPKLGEVGATAENIAEEYAREIKGRTFIG